MLFDSMEATFHPRSGTELPASLQLVLWRIIRCLPREKNSTDWSLSHMVRSEVKGQVSYSSLDNFTLKLGSLAFIKFLKKICSNFCCFSNSMKEGILWQIKMENIKQKIHYLAILFITLMFFP